MVDLTSRPSCIEWFSNCVDRGCVKGFERRYCWSEGILVSVERLPPVAGGVGKNKTVSTGKGDDKCVDRYRCPRKGYCVKVVATEH
jgi:hypothetical protein